jgi:hypothetical protein
VPELPKDGFWWYVVHACENLAESVHGCLPEEDKPAYRQEMQHIKKELSDLGDSSL